MYLFIRMIAGSSSGPQAFLENKISGYSVLGGKKPRTSWGDKDIIDNKENNIVLEREWFFPLQWKCIVWSSSLFNILSFNLILLNFSIQIQFGFQYACRKDALCYCILSFIPPFFKWEKCFAFRTQDNCILCSFLTSLQVCLDFFNCRVDNLSSNASCCYVCFQGYIEIISLFFHFTVHLLSHFRESLYICRGILNPSPGWSAQCRDTGVLVSFL